MEAERPKMTISEKINQLFKDGYTIEYMDTGITEYGDFDIKKLINVLNHNRRISAAKLPVKDREVAQETEYHVCDPRGNRVIETTDDVDLHIKLMDLANHRYPDPPIV